MDATLNIAIAAEFELSEKIVERLEQSALEISSVSIVEITPFEEEQNIRFRNKGVEQLSPNEVEWADFYVFFAGKLEQVSHIAQAAEQGCIVIDMLGVCSALSDVPVVVPTVNESQLFELRQRNIVSLPDPQVSQLALTLAPILQETNLNQVFATSLLPASYTDAETVTKLAGQTARLLNGIPLDEEETRLAFDVYPHQTPSLSNQLQRIFPQLDRATFHAIQVPVFYGLAQKVTALSDYDFDYQPQNSELITLEETLITPVLNGEQENGEESVKLHLSQISAVENGVEFWSVADEQRFNLALLSVKLLEGIYQQGY
ncbi:USG-1 protein [Haemophilus influenzae]|uniref:oxidoreductase n=1 Tax=Haemophilus influenzae TaxID=727 RepID=UPI000D016A2F|nr:oxidoreductase [Haemophilus influenzae]PRJ91447.1 USG-1 protein [Haemophilus influenzae]PRK62661.1 USG-1 protein [Haemophilus influenzae]PRM09919.1 USG-1 protein [Haemophilus influenzae]